MTDKVHGFASLHEQDFSGGIDVWKFVTTVDVTPTGARVYTPASLETNWHDSIDLTDPATLSQYLLDKVIETISLRGQPILLSAINSTEITADNASLFLDSSGKPIFPTAIAGATAYSFVFMIEHDGSWDVSGAQNPTLAEAIGTINGFEYGTSEPGNFVVQAVAANFNGIMGGFTSEFV